MAHATANAAGHPAGFWTGDVNGPVETGSAAHKRLFCRMLLDTHDPYKPAVIDWPKLDDGARQRLVSLPIWNIAVQTEGKAKIRVLTYGERIADPLLRAAIDMNGFEEGRHKDVLSNMVRAYGIVLDPEPPYPKPVDAEWAFMVTGYSECIDSFFAFGLFEVAKRSGYFPPALVDTFEPVMQEECRHILFYVNWVQWHRRNLPWWKKPLFDLRRAAVYLYLARERFKTASDMGGDNFTMTGHESMGIELDPADLIDVCLAENDRRMARYDQRLLRPTFVPAVARLIRRFMRKKKSAPPKPTA
jgi:hypothetical protein